MRCSSASLLAVWIVVHPSSDVGSTSSTPCSGRGSARQRFMLKKNHRPKTVQTMISVRQPYWITHS